MATWEKITTTGTVEAINPKGLKLDNLWWNVGRIPVDLAHVTAGQTVELDATVSPDGTRRFLDRVTVTDARIDPRIAQRQLRAEKAAAVARVAAPAVAAPPPDDPVDLADLLDPDELAALAAEGRPTSVCTDPAHVGPVAALRSGRAQAALTAAATLLGPWYARQKDLDPDAHIVCGFAQVLADWLEHYEHPLPVDDVSTTEAEQV